MHESLRSECASAEAYTLPWPDLTLGQVLVLSWLRTEGELSEMPDNQWVRESPYFNDLGLTTPPYARKPPIRVCETRGLYIALDCINFGTGLSRVLVAHRGRNDQNGR